MAGLDTSARVHVRQFGEFQRQFRATLDMLRRRALLRAY
jgi:hypothetical protein